MGWKSGESSYAAFDSEKYDANKVQVFCADWLSYNASITFNGENGIDGVFYYESGIPDGMDFIDGMSALSYNGKIYASESSLKMVIEILSGSKDGYCVNLWKDVDGNVVIKDVQKLVELLLDAPKDESESTLWEAEVSSLLEKILDFKDLNGDVNFYAEYEAKTYNIVYNSTFNNNNQVQKDLAVDAKVSLYGEVFLNEGFKLLGWTTSAGSSQVAVSYTHLTLPTTERV